MRSNRRRNWFIKGIALGFAVAAFAAPVAQAKIDEGSSVQANGYQAFATDFPSVPSGQVAKGIVNSDYPSLKPTLVASVPSGHVAKGIDNSDYPSLKPTVVAADYGMPRAMPNDYALSSGDQIEVVRAQPRGTSSDKIEFVRTQPRSIGEPQVVAAGFDWKDAGIGAGLALALVLLGGGAALASRHVGRAQTA